MRKDILYKIAGRINDYDEEEDHQKFSIIRALHMLDDLGEPFLSDLKENYIRGNTTDKEKALFEFHIDRCDDCKEDVEFRVKILHSLKAIRSVTNSLIEKAASFEKEGKLEEAIKCLEEALELRPGDDEITARKIQLESECECPFCNIIKGKDSGHILYEDELCCAFLDERPVNPGHIIVAPKIHADSLLKLPVNVGERMWRIAHNIAKQMESIGETIIKDAIDFRCEGINLFLADGRIAGNEVVHIHFHVIPRVEGDGFKPPRFGVSRKKSEPEDLDMTIQRMKRLIVISDDE